MIDVAQVPASSGYRVPVNLFGSGSPSRAALNYFLGMSRFRANIHQYVGAASVTGDLFQLDGRPVSVAFGVEYRNDKVVGTADPISQANGFTFGNPKSIAGSRDVIEGSAKSRCRCCTTARSLNRSIWTARSV